MEFKEGFMVALSSLAANKMRAFLTMLGIIIGVGAVITMISLGQGAKQSVSERIQSLGSNLLFVNPGAARQGPVRFEAGSRVSLKEKDVEALRQSVPSALKIVPESSRPAQVIYQNKNWNTRIVGTTPDYETVRNFPAAQGRYFNWQELAGLARVCVIGKTVVDNLFEYDDPVGAIIRINRMNFRVVGVLQSKGQSGWFNPDDQILIPLSTAQRRLFGIDYLSSITIQVADAKLMAQAQQEVEQAMRRSHRLYPNQESDFNIRSQAEILTMVQETSRTLTFLLGGIASVSLIVGGIGIMNIMLVSVTERTREIGIRKAIGAKRRDILYQFLIEALVLSLSGGLVGIALGLVGSVLLAKLAQWTTQLTPGAILLAFLFAAAVGIFFGLYPARKAAQQNPIEALRYE
ncbi:MAG: ABC transporter permease [candidate division KSB1 bacterium]|nr:ABC transporter permease [candidate division KSB1 bacterium]